MGKMLKMWDMCLSKKKKRVGLSQKKKRKEESGSVANSLQQCTNNLAINFNPKKKQLSYKLATTRNTSHKQRKTKMEDVKEGLPHVFCSFKKVLASTQQTRLEKLHGEKLGKKKKKQLQQVNKRT